MFMNTILWLVLLCFSACLLYALFNLCYGFFNTENESLVKYVEYAEESDQPE